MSNLVSLAVVGSRHYTDYEDFCIHLYDTIHAWGIKLRDMVIISGGAQGADSLAERFARENDVQIEIFRADWKKHGRAAGPIRNKLIIEKADYVLAYPMRDSNDKCISPGTMNSISLAKDKKIPCVVVWTKSP